MGPIVSKVISTLSGVKSSFGRILTKSHDSSTAVDAKNPALP